MAQSVGERIREIRKARRITLADLGSRVGIAAASLSRIESGVNNPADRTVKLVAQELGVREEWLKTGEGDPAAGADREALIAEVSRTYNLDESSEALLRVFLDLPPRQRSAMAELVHKLAAAHRAEDPPADPEE